MTWSETHRRLDALRAIEAELDRRRDGRLPWSPKYAGIFGDRHRLLLELRYRWWLLVTAQVEKPFDPSGRPSAEHRALAQRHPGLVAVLRRHAWELAESTGEQDRPEQAGVAR